MTRLKDKICLVTGGASGIGEGVATRFAREGAIVIIADINRANAEKVERDIREQGGRCEYRIADMGSEADIAALFRYIDEQYGGLDVMMTCAFWSSNHNAAEMPLDEWSRCLNVTLTGPFLCSKYAIPLMRKRGGGSIIHTSTTGSILPFKNSVSYVTAKAGINQLCKSIALDFGSEQIRCNAICPGIIDTPDTRSSATEELNAYRMSKCLTGRFGKPGDIANAALFLASDESDFVTGSIMTVDGGWTVN